MERQSKRSTKRNRKIETETETERYRQSRRSRSRNREKGSKNLLPGIGLRSGFFFPFSMTQTNPSGHNVIKLFCQ